MIAIARLVVLLVVVPDVAMAWQLQPWIAMPILTWGAWWWMEVGREP